MNPHIHEWQKAVLPNQISEEVIGIAKVFSDCSDLWGVVTHLLAQQHWIHKTTIRKLESAHSYIRLWADGYGVLSGKFEERLKNSQRAGDLTIRLLQSICQTLTQELTPIVAGISTVATQDATGLSLTAADLALSSERLAVLVQGDDDGEASEDSESVTSPGSTSREKLLEDIAEDLRNDTQCLLDLGARFEEQVMNPIASEAAASPLNSFDGGLSDTFIERIIRLYPQCESNLAGRIGNANWKRFLRISELRPPTSEGRMIQDRDTHIIHDATESEPTDFKSIVDTTSIQDKSVFHDSGLGTASHVGGSHPNLVRIVPENQVYLPLPEGAVQGKPFRCMACKNPVMIANEKEWRAHLLRDVEPYICPEPDCDAPLFTSTAQWEKHVDNDHPQSTIWSDSRCRICGKATIDRAMVIRHLIDHMEAIALTIIPGIDVNRFSVNDTYEEREKLTSSSKQDDKKRPRTTRPKIKTGCNGCKMRRIKCDEKRPSCGICTRLKVHCEGYPPPPRLREKRADSTFVEMPPPSSQPYYGKWEDTFQENTDGGWSPLSPETATSASVPDDGLDSPFIKPLPPTPTHQHLSDPIISHDSFALPMFRDDPHDAITMKRARNTLAARKSRERKAQRLEELEEKIAKLEQERDNWKGLATKHGAEHS